MNFFETVKQTVTTRQAAERYGLSVNQSGMTRCPFHEDHNPSMKVDDRFYCFGCGASGDVIDFTARLFGISLKDATEKLAEDFGINSRPPTQSDIHTLHAEPPRDRERLCICVLREYLRYLRIWQLRYHPERPGDPIVHDADVIPIRRAGICPAFQRGYEHEGYFHRTLCGGDAENYRKYV